jgi:glycosyltransferase involved in cell wall biosynthesis
MLRILHLSAPTALAGAERVILNSLQYYDTRSLSIRVASYLNHQRLDNAFTIALEEQGIPHDKIPIGNTSLVWQVRQTVDIIKRHSIDILHTHGYRSDFVGLIAARVAGIPIVSTVHGWTPVSLKLRGYQMLDRFCLKRFDRIVCVSNLLYEEFSKLGINFERLVYLPNAVSLPEQSLGQRDTARQQLGVESEENIIVAVGRLSPEKGLDILLAAYARQFSSDRGVRLILVGDGPEMAALKSLANRLGISEQVSFAGFAADVSNYYAAADLFVMSSHTEGFPMALLEAMAWGLPVLATAVGGIPDIVQDGKDGCLVPPGNEEQLVVAMGKLLNNRELSEKMGQVARQTITERFAVEQWAFALERVYAGVYEKRIRS